MLIKAQEAKAISSYINLKELREIEKHIIESIEAGCYSICRAGNLKTEIKDILIKAGYLITQHDGYYEINWEFVK